MRALGVFVVLVGLLSSPAFAETDGERADKLFVEGRDLLRAGKAQEACEKFHAANALNTTAPGVMLNLGLCYEKLGKIATSLKWFRKAQTAASEANPPVPDFEEAAKNKTKDLASKVGTIKIDLAATQPEVEIRVDGERIDRSDLVSPVELDAGVHKVEANAAGMVAYTQDATVVDGKSTPVKIAALDKAAIVTPAVQPKGGHKKLGYALVITGVVLGASIPFVANAVQNKYNDSGTDKSKARVILAVGGGVWVAAVAGAALGVYFIVKQPTQERRTALVPILAPDQLGAAVLGRF
ncbi:MAG: tetratricopeptide repeat protein [Kofleriaceae bacterium]